MNDKIKDTIKELIILCKKEKILGKHTRIILADGMEYYVSFDFHKMGMNCKSLQEKLVKERTQDEHQKLIKYAFNGNVRDYLLSMGAFKED